MMAVVRESTTVAPHLLLPTVSDILCRDDQGDQPCILITLAQRFEVVIWVGILHVRTPSV